MASFDFPIIRTDTPNAFAARLVAPIECSCRDALAFARDLERIVRSRGAEEIAPRAAGMVKIGAAVDDDGNAVDMKPHRQRIGMPMRGDGSESQRAVIKYDECTRVRNGVTNDAIAAIGKMFDMGSAPCGSAAGPK